MNKYIVTLRNLDYIMTALLLRFICPFMLQPVNDTIRNVVCYTINNTKLKLMNSEDRYNGFKIEDKKNIIDYNFSLPEIDASNIEKYKSIVESTILEFADKLKKRNYDGYRNFCKNGEKLLITDSKNFKDDKASGYYMHNAGITYHYTNDPNRKTYKNMNLIYIDSTISDEKYLRCVVLHELMHMSSAVDDDNLGMWRSTSSSSLGYYFNEGATSVMCDEYFDDYETNYGVYVQNCVRDVRTLIGEDVFENLYFSADLKGLILELAKYTDVPSAIQFILNLDDLNTYCKKLQKKDISLLMYDEDPIKKEIVSKIDRYLDICFESKVKSK